MVWTRVKPVRSHIHLSLKEILTPGSVTLLLDFADRLGPRGAPAIAMSSQWLAVEKSYHVLCSGAESTLDFYMGKMPTW